MTQDVQCEIDLLRAHARTVGPGSQLTRLVSDRCGDKVNVWQEKVLLVIAAVSTGGPPRGIRKQ